MFGCFEISQGLHIYIYMAEYRNLNSFLLYGFFFWSNYCMAMDLYLCPEGHVNMLLGLCAQDMAQYRDQESGLNVFGGKV